MTAAFESFDGHEPVPRVEFNCVRLCVNQDADATNISAHLLGELDGEAKKRPTDPYTTSRLVHREPSYAENGYWIWRHLATRRQIVAVDAVVDLSPGGILLYSCSPQRRIA